MVEFLKCNFQIDSTTSYEKLTQNTFIDLRGKLTTGARTEVTQQPYNQTFGQTFHKNLCILDLLFNLGNQTGIYLSNKSLHLAQF
jgi:hypothetical protein